MRLKTTLIEHQAHAIDKLKGLKVSGLFMEMGTGKTRTAIEFVALREHKIDRVFIICPLTLTKLTWLQELEKHIESPSVYVFDDKTRQGRLPDAQFYIVGVESLSQSNRIVLAFNELVTDQSFVILDESDTCKNHRALRTARITAIAQRAKYRMILTGTAVGEGMVDLYSQMYFLSPEILGYKSFYSFARNHLEYSDKFKGMIVNTLRTDWIAKKIDPYVYQCKKDECLDLPDKLYTARYCELTYKQRQLYQQAKEEILWACPDDELESFTIFQLFTALREIVSGFWNRYPDPHAYTRQDYRKGQQQAELITAPHYRLDLLMSAIAAIPSTEKVIIWSNFQYCTTQIVEAIADEYGDESYSRYDGQVQDRDRQLDQWRHESRFLIASPKCGGRGLTLVEASYQIFYNNDFPYRVREQAEDRIHRIGQTCKATYTDLVCLNSIDDKIAKALAKKESLAAAFKRELDKLKTPKEKRQKLMQL